LIERPPYCWAGATPAQKKKAGGEPASFSDEATR
jgi:hypothetical protein